MRKVWVENADLDSLECNNRLVPCLSHTKILIGSSLNHFLQVAAGMLHYLVAILA